MTERPAREMSESEMVAEEQRLDAIWKAMQVDLEESGGMAGSPGEWITERFDEINTERKRRMKLV